MLFGKSAFEIYKRYYTQVMILESLSVEKGLDNAGMARAIVMKSRERHEIYWSVTLSYANEMIAYLASIDMIGLNEDESLMILTDSGVEALRQGTFQNMASSAYFSYRGLRVAGLAAVAAIGSLTVSAISILLQLC